MESLISGLGTAFDGIVSDVTSALTSAAPKAVPVIGVGLVVTLAVKVFKRVANKA